MSKRGTASTRPKRERIHVRRVEPQILRLPVITDILLGSTESIGAAVSGSPSVFPDGLFSFSYVIVGNLINRIVDPEVILGIIGRSATRYNRDELPMNVFTIGRERHVNIFRTPTDDTRAGTLATLNEYLRTSLNRLDNSLRSTDTVVPAPVVSASR